MWAPRIPIVVVCHPEPTAPRSGSLSRLGHQTVTLKSTAEGLCKKILGQKCMALCTGYRLCRDVCPWAVDWCTPPFFLALVQQLFAAQPQCSDWGLPRLLLCSCRPFCAVYHFWFQEFKEKGNALFKEGKYNEAQQQYKEARNTLGSFPWRIKDQQLIADQAALRIVVMANQVQCLAKQENWREVCGRTMEQYAGEGRRGVVGLCVLDGGHGLLC